MPPDNSPKLRDRLTLYVLLRLVLGFLFLGFAGFLYVAERWLAEEAFEQLFLLTFGLLGISAFGLQRTSGWVSLRSLAWFQHAIDASILVGLLAYTGGTKSVFAPLFLLSVVASAYLIEQRGALMVATIHSIAFAAVGALQYFDQLPVPTPGLGADETPVYADVLIMTFGCYLTAFLSGMLARQAQEARDRARLAVGQLEVQAARTRRLQQELSQVVLSLRSGLAIFDAEGRLRSANAIALELFPELEATDAGEVFPQLRRVEELVWEVERDIGGQIRHIILARSPLDDGGVVLTMEDVTRLRGMERTIQREERHAAVGRLAAAMAHEIRNPLTSLSSAVQLIGQVGPNERLITIVRREVDRLDRLVNDLLNAARPREIQLAVTELRSLVEDVVEIFRADARYKETVQVELDQQALPALLLDPEQIRQVLWNLILNAAQAMPAGGTIRIVTNQVGDRVRMTVADEGVGIDAHDLDKVFDPFYSTREGGTGLGLATVDRVIQRHGGEVFVHSARGSGTTFVIWLPLNRADKEASQAIEARSG